MHIDQVQPFKSTGSEYNPITVFFLKSNFCWLMNVVLANDLLLSYHGT